MQIHKDGPDLVQLIEQFKRLPLLQVFERDILEQILAAGSMVLYGTDEPIISEGAAGDRLYVLLRGKVRVMKNKKVIAVLDQVGEVFGELSMFGQEARTASVYAVETACCLELTPSLLHKLPRADRDACHALLYRFIAQVIANRLMKTTDELVRATDELETTRSKLDKLRQSPRQDELVSELELAIGQLQWTREKLSQLVST